ncbi:DUF2953 domain-containing protein [Mobilitalea sibirica]|uniref:DUF2953 domain-containing protein n=1 Tax=Mobilitalea sibirica TaxID=1462919 RepID=A0A8J7H4U8_9FIRM|nr:DUF2953 domain-containing protein [Mobilitalea sibirica]MBH1939691.1 DUF2953 domain-containing protein [Mobilitalea sibirica]
MFHIIILILKIIGTIVISLLGLLIFILLLVLLVPIRYRLHVTHGDGFHVKGTAGWLLHIVHARIDQINTTNHLRVRIFGKIVYDSLKVNETSHNKKRGNRLSLKKKKMANDKKIKSVPKLSSIDKNRPSIKPIEKNSNEKSNQRIEKNKDNLTVTEKNDLNIEDKLTDKPGHILRDEQSSYSHEQPPAKPVIISEGHVDEENEQESFYERITDKLKRVFQKVKNFFQRIKSGIIHWFLKICHIKRKLSLLFDFLRDEINQDGLKATFDSAKKLIKHILPTKLKSRVIFGTGDPCSTGQALGAFSILYSFYGDNIVITPDFENKVFEGEHFARGRIRLITILIIVIKLIRDKRFIRLKRNAKTLKEAL